MPRLAAICDGPWPCRLNWLTCAAWETETLSSDDCVAGAGLVAEVPVVRVGAGTAESVPEMEIDMK
jgi:hypothetical protein